MKKTSRPKMSKPDLSAQQLVRKERVQELVDSRFGGVARRLANKVNKNESYVRNLLNGRKGMGEKVARDIEKALALYPGYLDAPSRAASPRKIPQTVGDDTTVCRYGAAYSKGMKEKMTYVKNYRGQIVWLSPEDVASLQQL